MVLVANWQETATDSNNGSIGLVAFYFLSNLDKK